MKQEFLLDGKVDLLSNVMENNPAENLIYEPENTNVYPGGVINDISASKKKDDDEDEEINDDFYDDDADDEEEKEEIENPFDREPTDKEIIENDLPFDNPEEDLPDDDEEIPYN